MGASLATLKLQFELNEIDENFRKNVEIKDPECPVPITDFESSVLAGDLEDVKTRIQVDPSCVTNNSVMIAIANDQKDIFDSCFTVYSTNFFEQYRTEVEKSSAQIREKTGSEKNVITDLFDDLTFAQIMITFSLQDIVLLCSYVKNQYYFERVLQDILNNMGTFTSFAFFWNPVTMLGKRNNFGTLQMLDSHGKISQRLMMWVAYGGITGNNIGITDWAFSHNEKKVPILDCLLNAMVYLNRTVMFEKYSNSEKAKKEYLVPEDLIKDVVAKNMNEIFLMIVERNLFPDSSCTVVMDHLMKLGRCDLMAQLMCLEEKERVDPERSHLEYIYRTSQTDFNFVVSNYKGDVVADVLCEVIDSTNVQQIIQIATKGRSRENLCDKDILLLMSGVKDELLIRKVFQDDGYDFENTDNSVLVEVVTNSSSVALYNVLTKHYGLEMSVENIQLVVRTCNPSLCRAVTQEKSFTEYPTKDLLEHILYRADDFTKEDMEWFLDLVLKREPKIKQDRYSTHWINRGKPEVFDCIIEKLKLNKHEILECIKYGSDDVIFYHVWRKYLNVDSDDSFKQHVAQELSYSVEGMVKGKEFNRLVFMVKEMLIPLEFSVLQHVGKLFEPSRFSILSDPVKDLKKNKVTYEMMAELLYICHNRARLALAKNFNVSAPAVDIVEPDQKRQRTNE